MYTEEEQLAQIRDWFKRYGKFIIIGIVLIVLASTSWRFLQVRQKNRTEQASILFGNLLVSKDKKEDTALEGQGNYLLSEYPDSIYAQMGALVLAQQAVKQKHYDKAVEKLQWALTHGDDPSLRQLARLRLTRILLFQQQYDDALAVISKQIEDKHYLGEIDGVTGDIYLATGDKLQAQHFYEKALKHLPPESDLFDLYQLKLYQVIPAEQEKMVHPDPLPTTAANTQQPEPQDN